MDQKNIEFNINNGYWWPKWEDRQQEHFDYHTKHLRHARDYVNFCSRRRVLFQAGGNVGIWPNFFADHFDAIITAEPDPDLHACLMKNKLYERINVLSGAVGESFDNLNFFRTGKSGTGTVSIEKIGVPSFVVKQFTIDSLELDVLDGIYLDVEGFEEQALRGAEETIKRCKPIVCCETFDRTRNYIDAVMYEFGYQMIKRNGRDQIYALR